VGGGGGGGEGVSEGGSCSYYIKDEDSVSNARSSESDVQVKKYLRVHQRGKA